MGKDEGNICFSVETLDFWGHFGAAPKLEVQERLILPEWQAIGYISTKANEDWKEEQAQKFSAQLQKLEDSYIHYKIQQ